MVADGRRVSVPMRLCAASLLWGVVVVSAGFWFPAGRQTTEVCPSGRPARCTTVGESTFTLVTTDGVAILFWLAAPVVVTLVVAALVLAARHGSLVPRAVAWCAVGALWFVSVLSGFSVGLWFLPSALLLTVAVGVAGTPSGAPATRPTAAPR